MPVVRRGDGRRRRRVEHESAVDGPVEPPRSNSYGRPRNAAPPRDDGFSEGTIRNVIARYGERRVKWLIRQWEEGGRTDGDLAHYFGISASTMQGWRRAFGVTQKQWIPFYEISSLCAGPDPT